MPLYNDIKTALITNLNQLNGASVRVGELTFSKPQPTNGKWNGKDVTQNTAVRITATAGASWTGTTVLLYNRLKLSDLSTLIGNVVKVSNIDTVWELISALNSFYGLGLDTTDFVNDAIAINSDGNGTVDLTALPTSLGWTGTWSIAIAKGDANLPDAVSNTTLNGLYYPVSEDITKRLAQSIFYGSDFTDVYDTIKGYAPGKVLDDDMLAIINAHQSYATATGKWVNAATPAAQNNLYGTTVVSNGKASEVQYANSDRYEFVVVLRPSASTLSVRGDFLFHYNKPLDPTGI